MNALVFTQKWGNFGVTFSGTASSSVTRLPEPGSRRQNRTHMSHLEAVPNRHQGNDPMKLSSRDKEAMLSVMHESGHSSELTLKLSYQVE